MVLGRHNIHMQEPQTEPPTLHYIQLFIQKSIIDLNVKAETVKNLRRKHKRKSLWP